MNIKKLVFYAALTGAALFGASSGYAASPSPVNYTQLQQNINTFDKKNERPYMDAFASSLRTLPNRSYAGFKIGFTDTNKNESLDPADQIFANFAYQEGGKWKNEKITLDHKVAQEYFSDRSASAPTVPDTWYGAPGTAGTRVSFERVPERTDSLRERFEKARNRAEDDFHVDAYRRTLLGPANRNEGDAVNKVVRAVREELETQRKQPATYNLSRIALNAERMDYRFTHNTVRLSQGWQKARRNYLDARKALIAANQNQPFWNDKNTDGLIQRDEVTADHFQELYTLYGLNSTPEKLESRLENLANGSYTGSFGKRLVHQLFVRPIDDIGFGIREKKPFILLRGVGQLGAYAAALSGGGSNPIPTPVGPVRIPRGPGNLGGGNAF